MYTVHVSLVLALAVVLGCGGSSKSSTATTPPPPSQAATAEAATCPDTVLEAVKKQGGACMEPAVLGEDVAKQCTTYLEQHGWQHDDVVEKELAARTQKTLVCYRSPGSDGP
jgi:hypothetical protein